MLQLELTKASAVLENFNPRTEKNGPDRVPATTLRFTSAQGADVLAHFSPTLRDAMFVEDSDLAGATLRVRDPHTIWPMRRDESMTGATVEIAYGVGKPIALTECEIKDFSLTPNDGGTVQLSFNVNCKPDADKDIPKLYKMMAQACELTLIPVELPELGGEAKK